MLLLKLIILSITLLGNIYSTHQVPNDVRARCNSNKNLIHLDSLEQSNNVYYFGVGSNMLRSKVENRGRNTSDVNNTSISLKSFRPAMVKNYRLGSFNMRGFPPIEPAMGGIEPCINNTCHGALIEMTTSEYHKLWLSEGGGQPNPGYFEEIVECIPYGEIIPVKAIALRAAEHSRLTKDANPSRRYMNILIKGATELQLEPTYIDYLKNIKIAEPSSLLIWMSKQHMHLTTLLFRYKIRWIHKFISNCLWAFYIPYDNSRWKLMISEIFTAIILLPGTLIGLIIQGCYLLIGKKSVTFFDLTTKNHTN